MSIASSVLRPLAALIAAALLAPLVAADVLVVDGSGGGDFTDIQPAVLAAAEGDVILVKPFDAYGPFQIQGKSLVLAADGGTVLVQGNSKVRDLVAGQSVVLSGLIGVGDVSLGPGLTLVDNAGSVRVQDCAFSGAANPGCLNWPNPGDGRPGAWVQTCADVAFRDTVLSGGDGAGGVYEEPCYIGGTGGHGLYALDSMVTVAGGHALGGAGGDAADVGLGGDGGHGLSVTGGTLRLSGVAATGGRGGIGDDFIPITGYGNGGDGLAVEAGAAAELLDVALLAGAAGMSALGVPGEPGAPLTNHGSVITHAGSSHAFDVGPLAREAQDVEIAVDGAPGDGVLLLAQLSPGLLPLPEYGGALLLGLPLLLDPLALGSVPAGGTLELAFPVPELGPGFEAIPVHLQGAVAGSAGLRLTGAGVVVLLDTAY